MSIERYYHSATLLPGGKVLVAGGTAGGATLATAEVYDPTANSWQGTASMPSPRYTHGSVQLPGGVLVVGGSRMSGSTEIFDPSAELYDASSGTWTSAGSMTTSRWGHTVTLLASGKVLVVGGFAGTNAVVLGTAELYDPSSNTWSTTGSMAVARAYHTATVLSTGKVLVAGGTADVANGGTSTALAEIYDPATGTFSSTGSLPSSTTAHSATALPGGRVLVAGGARLVSGAVTRLASAALYDPTAGTWVQAASMRRARSDHAAALLPSGKVLVVAGSNPPSSVGGEVYDPVVGTWVDTPSVREHGDHAGLVSLPDGRILVMGGLDLAGGSTSVKTLDIFSE
jgi:N-acetylneuraminic acid mutarotase